MKPISAMLVLLLLPFLAQADTHGADTQRSATRISSIIIYSPRMEDLAKFYEDGLALSAPATVLDIHIGYWLGDNYLGFEPVDEDGQESGGVSAWFAVDDIDETLARLLRMGAKPHTARELQSWGDIHASVLDPDGNVLGLIQLAEQR